MTAVAREATRSATASNGDSRRPQRLTYRPELNGFRGIAILLVVLGHLIADVHPSANVGVIIAMDIFFVQSGFLITLLLMSAFDESRRASWNRSEGSVPIKGFYFARATRILPAELVMVAAVLVGSLLLFNSVRYHSTQVDGLWTAFSAENLNLMAQSRDYFAIADAPSPLQHCWSLGIEEQFYLVWPLLMAAAIRMRFLKRIPALGRDWQRRVLTVALAVAAVSLLWSWIASSEHPLQSYFSPLTRAWVILVGAAIAAAPSLRNGVEKRLAGPLCAAGLAMIAIALFVVRIDTPYPGLIALLPACGTGLLIIGMIRPNPGSPMSRFFTVRPLGFIGRISYSLYLWHWPVIVFAAVLIPKSSLSGVARIAVLGGLAIALAWLSFVLVERPFRRIGKLQARLIEARRSKSRDLRGWFRASAMAGLAALALLTVASLSRPRSAVAPSAADASSAIRMWAISQDRVSASRPVVLPDRSVPLEVRAWRSQLRRAAGQTHVPANVVSIAGLGLLLSPPRDCYTVTSYQRGLACSMQGRGGLLNHWPRHVAPRVALVGDSEAAQWRETIAGAVPSSVWVVPMTMTSCDPATPTSDHTPRGPDGQDCGRHASDTDRFLNRLRPGLTVVVLDGTGPRAQLYERTQTLLSRLRGETQRLLVMTALPQHQTFAECLPANGTNIAACNAAYTPELQQATATAKDLSRQAGAGFMSAASVFCLGDTCPAFINDFPVTLDGTHFTSVAMQSAAPFVAIAIRDAAS